MCRVCERSLDDFEPLLDCPGGNCCMECTDVFFRQRHDACLRGVQDMHARVRNHSTGRPRQAGRGLGTAARAFDGKNVIVSRYGNFSCAHINSKASCMRNLKKITLQAESLLMRVRARAWAAGVSVRRAAARHAPFQGVDSVPVTVAPRLVDESKTRVRMGPASSILSAYIPSP